MTTYTVISALVLAIPAVLLYRRFYADPSSSTSSSTAAGTSDKADGEPKTIMQPAQDNLPPPKDDPFTLEQLREFDGSDASKPIYVAIKGTVFDVTRKRDTYGKGGSYNLFAGKDASRALGMSSLKEEDASPDYSTLSESDMKVLNDWHDFFTKRYGIVGKVVDLPAAVANL